jgi:hypothetical protein
MMAGFRVAGVEAPAAVATAALPTPPAARRPNGNGARMPLVGSSSGRSSAGRENG